MSYDVLHRLIQIAHVSIKCIRIYIPLQKANIVGEGVGLRPVRSQVKLDSNEFTLDNGNTVIYLISMNIIK